MAATSGPRVRAVALLATVLFFGLQSGSVTAGDPPRWRPFRRAVPTRAQVVRCEPRRATLGTFSPTPYIMVRGNDPVGGGYSPLGIYGDQTMALYGPFSPLRPYTAPVIVTTRGYDGVYRSQPGVSTSTPNLPELSPIVYPNESRNYYGPRVFRTPPSWSSAINWIDQN